MVSIVGFIILYRDKIKAFNKLHSVDKKIDINGVITNIWAGK